MAKLGMAIAINLAAEKFKSGIKSVQSQLSQFKKFVGSAFVGLGIVQFTKDVAAAGGAFQDAMARVKSVSKASRNEFKMMKDEAMLMGATTKYTASMAADALEILVRNGFKAKEATQALSGVLQLAQSQAISLAESADIATRTIRGFGLQVTDLGRVNDVLASAAANSASNVLEFSEALKIASPVAATLGISIEETMTALGELGNKGLRGSDAGTAIKQILTRISSQTPEAQKVLKKYGLEINETTLRTKGLIATLDEMRRSGMGNSLEDIKEFAGMLASPKLAALLKSPMDELYNSVNNSEGEAARMFMESLGEFEKAKWELKSIYENSQIKVFDGLKNVFTQPLVFLTELIKRLQDLPTLATIAFGVIAAKSASAFMKVRSNLFNSASASLNKELQQLKDKVNDTNIAKNFRQTDNRIIRIGGDDRKYYHDLNNALKTTTSQFDLASKGGRQYASVLKSIDYLSKHNASSSAAYQRHLANYRNYVKTVNQTIQADNKKSTAQQLATFEQGMRGQIQSATSGGNVIKKVFTNIGAGIKSFGQGLFAMMGGWVGMIMILAGVIGTYLVSAYRNSTKMAREMNNAHKEAIQKNVELDTTFRNLVDVLHNNERSTTQYKAALAVLKREYPELIEKLELEKISVNNSAEEWKKYKNRIDDVIESQKKLNLATMKIDAQKKMQESISDSSEYKAIRSNLETVIGKSGKYDKETGKIFAESIASNISVVLFSELDATAKKSKIKEILESQLKGIGVNAEYTRTVGGAYSTSEKVNMVDVIMSSFNKLDNKITPLINNLSHINTDDAKTSKTGDAIINDYLSQQKNAFELQRKQILEEGQARGKSLDDINNDIKSHAEQRIDDIFKYAKDNLADLKDNKGNSINVTDFIKNNSDYTAILQASKYQKPVSQEEKTKQKNIAKHYSDYGVDKAKLDEQLNKKVKTQEEYDRALYKLITSTVTSLRKLGVDEASDSFKNLSDANDEYAKKVADYEETDRIKKEENKRLTRLQENSQKKYDNLMSGAGKEKINKWDLVSDDEFNEESVRVEYLKNQLDGLKQLRADIGSDAIELVDELDNSIGILADHVENLEDAFMMKKAQKELKNLKRAMNEDVLGAVTSSWNAVGSLKSSFESISEAFKDGNDWDKFSAVMDGVLNLINTISSLINMYESLSETIKAYQTFQKGLASVETASAAEKITAIQGEAAAVVEAEGIKTVARTAAMGETATAAIASSALIAGANTTQFKTSAAAGIASAVQSAAALPFPANMAAMPIAGTTASGIFAGIPALVASIPMLAEGGVATKATLAMIGEGSESEAVLPLSKLNSMLDTARSQGTGGQVEFRIEGSTLVGALNNYNKRTKKLK